MFLLVDFQVSVRDLICQAYPLEGTTHYQLIVYDQCTTDTANLSTDCFLMVLLRKLVTVFDNVALLKGKSSTCGSTLHLVY